MTKRSIDSADGPHDPRSGLRRLAWLLDSSIRLPGGLTIGIDGLIGLVPGVGDALAAALSSYIIVQAARMNVAGSVLVRMGANVVLELLVGAIPLLGDLFDFVFKANERNVQLMDAYLDAPARTGTRSRWIVAAILAGILLTLLLALTIVISALQWLWTTMAS